MISLLKKCPLFRSMPDRELRKVLRFARVADWPAGTRIFNKADMARHLFIVVSGRVKIYSSSGRNKTKTFAYLGPGNFFGEMALLDAGARSASASAVEDSQLVLLHKRDFKRFLLSNPKLCYQLLWTLSERLRAANEQIEGLLFKNVLGRVSQTLCSLAKREGKKFRGGILIQGPHSRKELAELVGTTREPLSRALATLQRAQLLQFHHGQILLRDPKSMGALFNPAANAPENIIRRRSSPGDYNRQGPCERSNTLRTASDAVSEGAQNN